MIRAVLTARPHPEDPGWLYQSQKVVTDVVLVPRDNNVSKTDPKTIISP